MPTPTDPPRRTSAQPPTGDTLFLAPSRFVVRWPDGSTEERPLEPGVTRVGRGAEGNHLLIPAEYVSISRAHFEIRREGGEFLLFDLQSSNGVFVNGERVADRRALRHN